MKMASIIVIGENISRILMTFGKRSFSVPICRESHLHQNLQPIETRLVMLQTGMRAPMGIKVYGPDLPTIQSFGIKA